MCVCVFPQRLILRPGVDEEFDAAREKVETIEQQLQQHLEDLKEEVGISDMAYATVRNKEYLIGTFRNAHAHAHAHTPPHTHHRTRTHTHTHTHNRTRTRTRSPLTCWWISEIPRTPKNEAAIKRHKSTFIPINDTKSVGRYWTPTISGLFADLEKARTDLERCRLGLFARNQQKFSENHREWCVRACWPLLGPHSRARLPPPTGRWPLPAWPRWIACIHSRSPVPRWAVRLIRASFGPHPKR
jgi:DNA mismatch repair ATPase MutS